MKKIIIGSLLAVVLGFSSLAADPRVGFVVNPVPFAAFALGGSGYGGSLEVGITKSLAVKGYFTVMDLNTANMNIESGNDGALFDGSLSLKNFGGKVRYYFGGNGIRGLFAGANGKYLSVDIDATIQEQGRINNSVSAFLLGPEIGYKFAKKSGFGMFFEVLAGYNFLLSGKDQFQVFIDDFAVDDAQDSDFSMLNHVGTALGNGFVLNLAVGFKF